jgi:filamentous hemagglutinin family protein
LWAGTTPGHLFWEPRIYAHAALNRIYRLVWSALHQTWVVASELARGRGRSNAPPLLSAALLASLAAISAGVGAAPQGGQVVSGSGSISTSGSAGQSTTTINQASDKLSINWQSFNVAKAETVNFVQPSASALAVNRIFDTQGSQILGKINANGQVWLINPNGVLFGRDAQINVGGLLASTLNPDDASIGSARSNFSGSSTASVVNLGSINTTQGGYVAMLGHSVSNQGSINDPGGTVAMGAGSAISLNFAGSKLLGLEVTSNQLDALVENGGLIQADGGQVLLSAGARESLLASVVNSTGVIRADTAFEHNGKIVLSGGGSEIGRAHV